jgi:hypothetical protein
MKIKLTYNNGVPGSKVLDNIRLIAKGASRLWKTIQLSI